MGEKNLKAILPLWKPKAKIADRAVFVGKTGSGKTTLAEKILANYPYVVIHDAKGNIKFDGYKRYTILSRAIKAKEPKIIYAPIASELRDEYFADSFFRWIYQRRNTVCYVDEVTAITRGDIIPASYHDCLARGRERGISVFSSTQRPNRIPQIILSESEHYYVLRLKLERDRDKVEKTTGLDREIIETLPHFDFYYVNDYDKIGPLRLRI